MLSNLLPRLSCDVSQPWHILLWLNLLRLSGETSHKTPSAVLKLAVLGGVDERVDAAVGDHQHNGEVVEPADKRVRHWKSNELTCSFIQGLRTR